MAARSEEGPVAPMTLFGTRRFGTMDNPATRQGPVRWLLNTLWDGDADDTVTASHTLLNRHVPYEHPVALGTTPFLRYIDERVEADFKRVRLLGSKKMFIVVCGASSVWLCADAARYSLVAYFVLAAICAVATAALIVLLHRSRTSSVDGFTLEEVLDDAAERGLHDGYNVADVPGTDLAGVAIHTQDPAMASHVGASYVTMSLAMRDMIVAEHTALATRFEAVACLVCAAVSWVASASWYLLAADRCHNSDKKAGQLDVAEVDATWCVVRIDLYQIAAVFLALFCFRIRVILAAPIAVVAVISFVLGLVVAPSGVSAESGAVTVAAVVLLHAALLYFGKGSEEEDRKHFAAVVQLYNARARVRRSQLPLLRVLRSAVPDPLLKSFAAASRLEEIRATDHTDHGAIAITEIFDFHTWASKLLPQHVVLVVHHTFRVFDANARRFGVVRTAIHGDAYIVTTGLLACVNDVDLNPESAAYRLGDRAWSALLFARWQQSQARTVHAVLTDSVTYASKVGMVKSRAQQEQQQQRHQRERDDDAAAARIARYRAKHINRGVGVTTSEAALAPEALPTWTRNIALRFRSAVAAGKLGGGVTPDVASAKYCVVGPTCQEAKALLRRGRAGEVLVSSGVANLLSSVPASKRLPFSRVQTAIPNVSAVSDVPPIVLPTSGLVSLGRSASPVPNSSFGHGHAAVFTLHRTDSGMSSREQSPMARSLNPHDAPAIPRSGAGMHAAGHLPVSFVPTDDEADGYALVDRALRAPAHVADAFPPVSEFRRRDSSCSFGSSPNHSRQASDVAKSQAASIGAEGAQWTTHDPLKTLRDGLATELERHPVSLKFHNSAAEELYCTEAQTHDDGIFVRTVATCTIVFVGVGAFLAIDHSDDAEKLRFKDLPSLVAIAVSASLLCALAVRRIVYDAYADAAPAPEATARPSRRPAPGCPGVFDLCVVAADRAEAKLGGPLRSRLLGQGAIAVCCVAAILPLGFAAESVVNRSCTYISAAIAPLPLFGVAGVPWWASAVCMLLAVHTPAMAVHAIIRGGVTSNVVIIFLVLGVLIVAYRFGFERRRRKYFETVLHSRAVVSVAKRQLQLHVELLSSLLPFHILESTFVRLPQLLERALGKPSAVATETALDDDASDAPQPDGMFDVRPEDANEREMEAAHVTAAEAAGVDVTGELLRRAMGLQLRNAGSVSTAGAIGTLFHHSEWVDVVVIALRFDLRTHDSRAFSPAASRLPASDDGSEMSTASGATLSFSDMQVMLRRVAWLLRDAEKGGPGFSLRSSMRRMRQRMSVDSCTATDARDFEPSVVPDETDAEKMNRLLAHDNVATPLDTLHRKRREPGLLHIVEALGDTITIAGPFSNRERDATGAAKAAVRFVRALATDEITELYSFRAALAAGGGFSTVLGDEKMTFKVFGPVMREATEILDAAPVLAGHHSYSSPSFRRLYTPVVVSRIATAVTTRALHAQRRKQDRPLFEQLGDSFAYSDESNEATPTPQSPVRLHAPVSRPFSHSAVGSEIARRAAEAAIAAVASRMAPSEVPASPSAAASANHPADLSAAVMPSMLVAESGQDAPAASGSQVNAPWGASDSADTFGPPMRWRLRTTGTLMVSRVLTQQSQWTVFRQPEDSPPAQQADPGSSPYVHSH